jgi:hypothetical protein
VHLPFVGRAFPFDCDGHFHARLHRPRLAVFFPLPILARSLGGLRAASNLAAMLGSSGSGAAKV